jgi:CRP-like cAMP-binding protein
MATSRFFPFLTAAEESALLASAPVKAFMQDQLVIDQNTPSHAIFVIEEGSVRVELLDRGATIPLRVMRAGEFFGEMSFVDGQVTSARIVADEPTRLRVVGSDAVDRLSTSDASFSTRLYRSVAAILAQRVRLLSGRVYVDQSWG